MSFYATLQRRWRPDHIALRSAEGSLSYGQLSARVLRAAGWLLAQGVSQGDTIALHMPRCQAFLELHLAALCMGMTTLPLNDRYTLPEIQFFVQDSGAALAVVHDAHVADLPGSTRCVPASEVRDGLDRARPPTQIPVVSPSAIAVLCYTSGTTGRPKGARITHHNLEASVRALHQAWRWSERDVLVHALPLFHIHGLFVAQHGALYAGATTLWLDRFDPAEAMRAMSEGGTIFMGVPTFYNRFLRLPEDDVFDLSGARLFTSGSAPLPAEVHRRFEARFAHRVLERYGMTEVGIVLSNPYEGERRPGAVGFPLPGVRAQVVHPETHRVLPAGEVGELRIAGPSVFAGYLNLPDQTAASMHGEWMKTGDLSTVDEDGYFHIVGRRKDLVITGGLNVYPREVEAALVEHPEVIEAAVVGVPDDDLGERVVATVVGQGSASPRALILWCRGRLAPYKCPKAIAWSEELPRNAMGKVQKATLRQTWSSQA